jgi:hypothetical protein
LFFLKQKAESQKAEAIVVSHRLQITSAVAEQITDRKKIPEQKAGIFCLIFIFL